MAKQYLSSFQEFQRTAKFWSDTYAVKVGDERLQGLG